MTPRKHTLAGLPQVVASNNTLDLLGGRRELAAYHLLRDPQGISDLARGQLLSPTEEHDLSLARRQRRKRVHHTGAELHLMDGRVGSREGGPHGRNVLLGLGTLRRATDSGPMTNDVENAIADGPHEICAERRYDLDRIAFFPNGGKDVLDNVFCRIRCAEVICGEAMEREVVKVEKRSERGLITVSQPSNEMRILVHSSRNVGTGRIGTFLRQQPRDGRGVAQRLESRMIEALEGERV
jgi:hypothetical protein